MGAKKINDKPLMASRLKYAQFAHLYLSNGMNAKRAYMEVFEGNEVTANSRAYEIVNHKIVQEIIIEQQQYMVARATVTREMLVSDLMEIIAVSKSNTRLHSNALSAIKILNSMFGFDSPIKVELEHKGVIVHILPPNED